MSRNESPPGHPLDLATTLEPVAAHRWRAHTSPDYANMVGPFGGVTAATMLRAPLVHPERLGEPVALTVNYCGPIQEGEYFVGARPVRTNRSTQHWLIEVSQDDEVAATATAVFATRRDTWSATEPRMPEVPPADAVAPAEALAFTSWPSRYDMRFVRGALALDDDASQAAETREHHDSVSTLWLRDTPSRTLDFVSLTGLCDAFFPRIYVRRPRRVPIGTVTMTVYFHADGAMLAANGDRPLLGNARAQQFRNGYFDQSAEMWTADGTLIATTHQAVYYRE